MMKHYEKLLAKGSFSREQLIEIVGTATAANKPHGCLFYF